MRRSFRLGLWVGLLFGIGFALMKAVQSRRTSPEAMPVSKDPWPPISRVEPVAERPAPAPVPQRPAPAPPPPPPPPPPAPLAKAVLGPAVAAPKAPPRPTPAPAPPRPPHPAP